MLVQFMMMSSNGNNFLHNWPVVRGIHRSQRPVTRSFDVFFDLRADSRLVPSQWETLLQRNTVSHWLGVNLESALDLGLNKWLRKQSRSRLFETPSRSLWCHCNVISLSTRGPWPLSNHSQCQTYPGRGSPTSQKDRGRYRITQKKTWTLSWQLPGNSIHPSPILS